MQTENSKNKIARTGHTYTLILQVAGNTINTENSARTVIHFAHIHLKASTDSVTTEAKMHPPILACRH